MKALSALAGICALWFSCIKEQVPESRMVAFYALRKSCFVAGKCQIDGQQSTLQDTPVIGNHEILAYSRKRHRFRLTASAVQKLSAFQDNTALAVTVGGQVVYYFICKPVTSSSSCDHSITMSLDRTSGQAISMNLGYPGAGHDNAIPDRRNDDVLLEALGSQGKLRQ